MELIFLYPLNLILLLLVLPFLPVFDISVDEDDGREFQQSGEDGDEAQHDEDVQSGGITNLKCKGNLRFYVKNLILN